MKLKSIALSVFLLAAVAGAVAPQDSDVPAASILDLARSMIRLSGLVEKTDAEIRQAGVEG